MVSSDDVVFLHGIGTGPQSWEAQIAGLPPGYTGFAPAIAGTADGDPSFTLERAAADVVRRLDDRGADVVHVCGLSLGAMVAVQLTVDHPERVASLVLSGGQVRPPRALMAAQSVLMRLLPARLVAPDGTSKARVIAVLHEVARMDFRARLAGITVPTLVVCGSKDLPNLPAARALAAGIPGARLQIIDGARHEINTEDPDAFSAVLAQFLPAVRR